MYWIPAIFIFFELIYINYLDSMIRYLNCKILNEKFDDYNLKRYIDNEFSSQEKIFAAIGFILFFQLIYFIVALFYPFWFISTTFIFLSLISTVKNKIKKDVPIEKTIKLARLKNFESENVKFERLLKLNELNQKDIKTYSWIGYIYPIIKIIVFIAIIVLHYNYKIL